MWKYVASLRNRWLVFLLWPVLGTLAIAGLWQLEQSRESREQNSLRIQALQHAQMLSRSYAAQIDRTLEKLDELTAYIKRDWESSGGRLSMETLQQQGVFSSERLSVISIIGADGHKKTSVFPNTADVDFSDHAYFKHHSRNNDSALSISEPTLSTYLQQVVIHVTRRLNRPDGSFDGVIVAALDADFFKPLAENPVFGKHGVKALIGADGDVRFATIDTLLANRTQQLTIASAPCLVGKTPMRLDAQCFVDNQPRYAATAMLAHYPFRTMIALSEEEVFAPFLLHARASTDLIKAGALLIFFFCLFAWLLTIQLYDKRKTESEIRMTYRLATENGKDGFYLWRRVRDRFGTVIDFRVVDCNERGAALYNYSRAAMIGKTITDLYGDTPYRDIVVASGIQMDLDGEGESDYAVLPASKMTAKWLHVKFARTYEGIAVTLRDISEQVSNQDELARRATHDDLTDLPNRYWLTKSLPAMLQRAAHNNEKLAVLFVDLDEFKHVNDTLGHAAGDLLLRAVAERLQSLMRPGDRVARLGGDEFTVLLDKVEDSNDAAQVAERIVAAFQAPFTINGAVARVGASIGIALFPFDGSDSDTLLRRADTAMYDAKESKTGFSFFSDSGLAQRTG